MNNTILIMLLYYDRPKSVQNALQSVLRANEHYPYWKLGFFDDGSHIKGEPAVKKILKDHLDKVTLIYNPMSTEEKSKYKGTTGPGLNLMLEEIEADIGIILCDDDALCPTYMKKINQYFNDHPDITNCYSGAIQYNPLEITFEEFDAGVRTGGVLIENVRYASPIRMEGIVDASQIAWRIKPFKEKGIWFPDFGQASQDRWFFKHIYEEYGPTYYSGIPNAQYKADNQHQLRWAPSYEYALEHTLEMDMKGNKTKLEVIT